MDINLRGSMIDNDSVRMYRYYGFTDVTCPKDISDGLAKAKKAGEDATLLVNSGGGDVTVGAEIYSIIKRSDVKVTALVQGSAASAATVAMSGCETIEAEPGAILCYHNPWSYASGDYRKLSLTGDALKNVRDSIVNIYLTRAKKTRTELEELMDKNIWISPQQAKEYGLIDTVREVESEPTPDGITIAADALMGPVITPLMRQSYLDRIAAEETESRERGIRVLLDALSK